MISDIKDLTAEKNDLFSDLKVDNSTLEKKKLIVYTSILIILINMNMEICYLSQEMLFHTW